MKSAAIEFERAMPWDMDDKSEQRFQKILRYVFIVLLALSIVLTMMPVIEKTRTEAEKIPERIAQLIIEKKRQPPPPPPKPIAKAKPKPKIPKPKPKVVKKPVNARQKAEQVFAPLAMELAQLTNDPIIASIQGKQQLTRRGSKISNTERNIILDPNVMKGSGGINTKKFSRDVGNVGLKGRRTTKVNSPIIAKRGASGGSGERGGNNRRSISDVQLYIEKRKAMLDRLYKRALRRNSSLQGQVVLKFTILPSGKVANCKVISSGLKDPQLEAKIVALFSSFNFGSLNVASKPFTFPLDFFPESS